MICQNCLMNLKVNPSGPGLLSLPQSHTALFTSSSWKCPTKVSFWWLSMVWKHNPFNVGLSVTFSWNRCSKNNLTASLIVAGSSVQAPSINNPFRQLFLLLALIIKRWKCWWLTLTWSIWQHRNKIIFSDETFNGNRIMDDASFLLWTWLRCFEKDFVIDFNHWSSNLRSGFVY